MLSPRVARQKLKRLTLRPEKQARKLSFDSEPNKKPIRFKIRKIKRSGSGREGREEIREPSPSYDILVW
jgi:hypothetical protein